MKTYWEYSEQERSLLTDEQVRDLLKFELMDKGVLNVPPLDVTDPVKPAIPKTRYFGFKVPGKYGGTDTLDVAFTSAEAAAAFIDLNPVIVSSNYEYGHDNCYAVQLNGASQIELLELSTEVAIKNAAISLKQYEATLASNRAEREAHAKAMKTVEQATQGVWDDWHTMRQERAKHQRVASTFDEYVQTCEGDRDMAARFLVKAFSVQQVLEAFEWLGLPSPTLPFQPVSADAVEA